MTLDFDTCYRAVLARDPRFDGRFFTGVTSTGIYCRPICPARTPARRNMRFFPHAGAAEAAGFRACRRCRPEASPGSPDWDVRADLVGRAVRLIAEGYVDEHGVTGLARRLAVTERHLRRLLLAELGAGPLALARTIRLQTARRLLAETSMPITEIAFASGFSSVRQFNASFQESHGQPPSALRAGAPRRGPLHWVPVRDGQGSLRGLRPDTGAGQVAGPDGASPVRGAAGPDGASPVRETAMNGLAATSDGAQASARPTPASPAEGTWLILRLACREPFDADALLAFLGTRAIPGVETVSGGRYTRTVHAPGGPGLIELTLRPGDPRRLGRAARPGSRQVLLRVLLPRLRGLGQVVSRCRQLFDLDAEPHAIAAVLAADDALAPLVAARPGLRVPGAYDGFELAVRAVVGQQVSVPGARTLAGRIAARFGTPLELPNAPDATPTVLFPRPTDLAEADLSGLGLTTSRQRTLRALATAAATGRLELDQGADPEETAARLNELPGVGPWTVAYVLMRAVGDPDAFPDSDLGLRRALDRLGCEPSRPERWRPWRAYAAVHLWTWYSGAPAVTGAGAGE